jgi:hypothetical protein
MPRGRGTPILLVATLTLALGLSAAAHSLAARAPVASVARSTSRQPAAHRRHKAAPPPEVTLTPTITGASVPVAMQPVGLSIEYPVMAEQLGEGACPPPALVAQLQSLGSPPLALAGDSQDLTVPSGVLSGTPQSWEVATLYTLPAGFWSQLHCLLSASKDPLTVGLNLKTGAPSWAAQMVAGAQSAATNGLAFSLGNEPDLYDLPNYASLSQPVADEEAVAVNTYLQVASNLQQTLAGAPTVGPELARPEHWRRELPRVIAQLHLQTVGVHMYPLSACATPKAVTIGGLLSSEAASLPRSLAWVVADARAAGVPAIISEANSASCGGVDGVSDSPASAVWAVRFVLAALDTGFQEVRFHFSGNAYDPFVVRGEEVLARPLDSALAALNQWLPIGATLQSVAGVKGLVATRIGEPSGGTMLILDNQHQRSQPLVLRGAHSVSIQQLSAARAGLQSATLSSPRDHIELRLAANSVVAVAAPG